MPIPIVQNSSYPLVAPSVALINAFLELPDKDPYYAGFLPPSSIQLRLPRGQGSTFICHQAAEFISAFVILPSVEFANSFRDEHQKIFSKQCESPVFSIDELKNTRSISLLNPELEKLSQISKCLCSSKYIFMDVFVAYSQNNILKLLFSSCYKTHKFIIFS